MLILLAGLLNLASVALTQRQFEVINNCVETLWPAREPLNRSICRHARRSDATCCHGSHESGPGGVEDLWRDPGLEGATRTSPDAVSARELERPDLAPPGMQLQRGRCRLVRDR